MKILYFAQSSIPSRAANSVHVIKMCSAFRKVGLQVVLCAPKGCTRSSWSEVLGKYEGDPDLPIVWLRRSWAGSVGTALGWFRLLIGPSRDAEYVYSRSVLGACAARILMKRTILEVHEDIVNSSWIKRIALHLMVSQPGDCRLVVISAALKKYYESQYGIDENKILVASDGADKLPNNYRHPPVARDQSRSCCVGYVGSLLPGKGIGLVVELARRLPSFRFLIVGGTVQEVQSAAGGRELPDNLICMGYVDNKDVRSLIDGMDICLLPNQKAVKGVGGTEIGAWTSPLKLFEYMSLGKPIVASDLSVLREVLKHKKNSWLCNPEDPDEWAGALRALGRDGGLARKLGENARAEFECAYTWEARARNIMERCLVRR